MSEYKDTYNLSTMRYIDTYNLSTMKSDFGSLQTNKST